jgi:hypothetical protein
VNRILFGPTGLGAGGTGARNATAGFGSSGGAVVLRSTPGTAFPVVLRSRPGTAFSWAPANHTPAPVVKRPTTSTVATINFTFIELPPAATAAKLSTDSEADANPSASP